MKANELRIGNLVMDGKDIEAVNARMISMLENGQADFDPIPLTEEWLVRFGFRPDEGKIVFNHPEPNIPGNDQGDIGANYPAFFFNRRLNRWMDAQTRVCVDYAHQLQNLYFALTGEELTTKTPIQ